METEKLEGRFSNPFLSFSFQIKRKKKMGGGAVSLDDRELRHFYKKKTFL